MSLYNKYFPNTVSNPRRSSLGNLEESGSGKNRTAAKKSDTRVVDDDNSKKSDKETEGTKRRKSVTLIEASGSSSKLPIVSEDINDDKPKKFANWGPNFLESDTNLSDRQRPPSSPYNHLRLSTILEETKITVQERKRLAMLSLKGKANQSRGSKPAVVTSRPNLVSKTLAKKINQRMNKCKWCYKQCQDLLGGECIGCMHHRCGKTNQQTDTMKWTGSSSKTGAKECSDYCEKESTMIPSCKNVRLRHWDSNIAWNCRIELEQRLTRDLRAFERAGRQNTMSMRKKVQVIIVGAGLAGLSVADALLINGFHNVTVLEASDRIGGRIHTVSTESESDPNRLVELGVSELDHPTKWNSVFNLARSHMLLDGNENTNLPNSKIRHNQDLKSIAQSDSLSIECDRRSACLYNTKIIHDINAIHIVGSKTESLTDSTIQLSSKDFFREELRRVNKHIKRDDSIWQNATQSRIESFIEGYSKKIQYLHGDDKGDADIRRMTTSLKDHKQVTFQDGMASILEPLTKRFRSKTLKLKARVNKIDWSEFLERCKKSREEPMVNVSCTDGRKFKCNHVIVAVPLGFLKANAHSLFTPSIPDDKLSAIEGLGFGAVCKAFITFESPPYRHGFYITLTDIEGGDITTKTKVEKDIVSITSMPNSCIVQVTFSNSSPEEMNDEELMDDLTHILSKRLYRTIPQCIKLTKTSWKSNSLYQGTHPYIRASGSPKQIEILAQPIMVRTRTVIQFAGDASHRDYTCLLHAARESGLREAQRLMNIYDEQFGLENTNQNDVSMCGKS